VVLFVGSGCAALIYEIVWFQLLQLVIGSSAVSLGVLLGTFMGGMCLGSLLLPRVVSARRHPLAVYAILELAIGVIGLAVLAGMPQVSQLYASYAGHGLTAILVRGAAAAICLLPPTLLMGATLPAVARWVETTPRGVSWLGLFYGGNIAGAVVGSLLAGFYLLRVYDMATATYVAAAINAAVAVAGLLLAARLPHLPRQETKVRRGYGTTSAAGAWPTYVAIAISGLCALGSEVIWTRLLSLLLGGTVYTFSIILAVFLVGLGIGSSGGALIAKGWPRPRIALGACQLLLTAAIAWTAYLLSRSLPYWPIEPSLASQPWDTLQLDLVRCAWAILPAAVLWGASFPLAVASLAAPGQDSGRLVGGVYAANTLGAILGALGFSMLVVGWIGTQEAQRLLILFSMTAALLVLVPGLWPAGGREGEAFAEHPSPRPLLGAFCLLVGVGMAAWLAWTVPPVSGDLIAYGRNAAGQAGKATIIYQGEGLNASVAVTVLDSGAKNFHVSGKIEASSEPQDMRLQRMLGHIPALVHPRPRSVLVVGCGAGVTAGSFLAHPSVERVVVCEIEPLIPQVVAQHFGSENHNLMQDSRVQVVYDDARHFILTTDEKFDVITSDPINPWVKGAATLYTEEYFDLCRRRLAPGGVITQWVPLYESNTAAVKSELATFFRVFPHGTVWSNDVSGMGYDVVLLGHEQPLQIDIEALEERLGRNDHSPVWVSLMQVGFETAVDLATTFAAQAQDLAPWLADAEINRDRNLRLQYLAGLGVNSYREGAIYREMLAFRRYPEKLFVISAENVPVLKQRLGFTKPE
jgi:spermidine synthase